MTGNGAIRIAVTAALALALVQVSPAAAQRLSDGAIRGAVRDGGGSPIASAIVTLRDRLTSALSVTESSRSGTFVFTLLAAGDYDVTVEAFGHRPLRLERVRVRSGETTRLEEVLTASADANPVIEVRGSATAAGSVAGRYTASDLSRLPWQERQLSAAARLTTATDPSLELEGLPARVGGVFVNGMPVVSGYAPGDRSSAPVFSLSGFRQAELLSMRADVEWSGTAGPALSAQTLNAGARFEVRAFGDWAKGQEESGSLRTPAYSGMQAGAVLSGPVIRDTSGFVLGFETWRIETPIAFGIRFDSVAARALEVASGEFAVEESRVAPARLARTDAFSGFGRLDWRFGTRHTLSTTAAITSLPRTPTTPGLLDRAGSRTAAEGLDAFAAASLASRFSDRFGQEFRVSWDRGVRDFTDAAATPGTLFVNDGLAIGTDPMLNGRYEAQAIRLRESLYFATGIHFMKFGLSADLASYDQSYGGEAANRFWFSTVDAFEGATGYSVQRTGTAAASFQLPRYGFYVQDEIAAAPRLRVLLGVRWDMETLPLDDLTPNREWLRLTGFSADSLKKRHGRVSPRVEVEWRPDAAGRWAMHAAGGVWDAGSDPLIVGELLANDGSLSVSRRTGAFFSWPQATGSGHIPTLTLVAPGFQGARSTRAALQISRVLAPGFELQVGGTIRRTDLLPRRTDLNRAPEASGTDQYGRPVYGTLRKTGGLLVADAGSNRRFRSFDVVSSVSVDGWSEYRALSAGVRAELSAALAVEAQYTWSKTEDNWFMAREAVGAAAVNPFLTDESDWTEGVSDFDVPHRALVLAEASLPVLRGVRVAGLYRFRSGYPFTPGFRDGVDANGDGSLVNDPAFIDDGLEGFEPVAAAWPCLRTHVGALVVRNACRAESASFLDARLAIGLFGSTTSRAELVLDALNLINFGGAEPDRALLLLDPSRPLETNGSLVNVPLVLNRHFGEPLVKAAAGRMFRIGLSLKY